MSERSANRANVRVDAGSWLGELAHNWTYIGYDEINYTYVPEGRELLRKFGALQEQPYYVRAHHLFCTGNGHGDAQVGLDQRLSRRRGRHAALRLDDRRPDL